MTLEKELRWKRIIETDVLCCSYSQRVFASFGLLDSYNKGYFTLDDFVERGLIVEEFLSLNVNIRTSFHVMDSFREFDVDGNGIVPMEEFVEKVMEKLNAFSEDSRTIEESATNLMPSGNKTVNEMILLLKPEKRIKSNKIVAFIHIIEAYLRRPSFKNGETSLESSYMHTKDVSRKDAGSLLLREIIRVAMKNSILELYRRFHFKRKFCTHLIEYPSESTHCVWDNEKVETTSYEHAVKPSIYTKQHFQHDNQHEEHHCQYRSLCNVADGLFFLSSKPHCKWRRLRKNHKRKNHFIDSGNVRTSLSGVISKSNSSLIPKALNDEFDLSQLYILYHGLHVIKKVLYDFDIIADSSQGTPVMPPAIMPEAIVNLRSNEAEDCKILCNHLSRELSVAQFKLLQSEVRLKMFSALQVDINDISKNESMPDRNLDNDSNDEFESILPIKTMMHRKDVYGDSEIYEDDNIVVDDQFSTENANGCKKRLAGIMAYDEVCTFDDVMQEIFKLKGCAAFRGKEDSFLGHSLSSCTSVLHFSDGMMGNNEIFNQNTCRSREENSGKFCDPLTSHITSISRFVRSPRDLFSSWNLLSQVIQEFSTSSQVSPHPHIAHCSHDVPIDSRVLKKDENFEANLQCNDDGPVLSDQAGENREMMMNMAVELQLLREKLTRYNVANDVSESVSTIRKDEHRVQELWATADAGAALKDSKGISNDNTGKLTVNDIIEENEDPLQDNRDLIGKISRLELENRRLNTNIEQIAANMSKALQENLALRQKITRLEDSNAAAVMFQGHLQEDIRRERSLREDRESLYSRVLELERTLSLTLNKFSELQEENRQLQKMKDELEMAENRVSEMTDEISLLSIHNERADLAVHQVEEYRLQLREHAKIDRERALYIHKLELEAREAQLLRARSKDLSEEVQMYKSKVEMFPAFLAESARLRACNKAVFKSLNEHDKSSISSTARLKELEREILRLKSESKMYQYTEKKLKDANLDYKHLSEAIGVLSLKDKRVESNFSATTSTYKSR